MAKSALAVGSFKRKIIICLDKSDSGGRTTINAEDLD